MKKIRLNILSLSVNQKQPGTYVLMLAELNGKRKIPVIIGQVEAQAIAVQLEGLKPPRPLTHDLIKNIAMEFDIVLLDVTIYKIEEGVFYSELLWEMNGKKTKVDSRTSDAIALALRFSCPVYTLEDIFRKAGIEQEDSCIYDFEETENSTYSHNQLKEMLNEAIRNEDYEKASLIRDELQKRGKQ